MFPIFLNLADHLVVVVGGGSVGMRKAAAALASGARVHLIEPLSISLPSPLVVHVPEAYRSNHLVDACLVFAAATPEVNAQVVADAKCRGIWVNSATDPGAGDFILPSVVRSGDLTLATSTGGASPALARRVREKLEAEFDDAFAKWVRVLAEVRPVVLAVVDHPVERRKLLDGLADWSWLARLRTEGADTVRSAMLEIVNGRRKK